ncbi:MAG: DUF3365 domain-containing protein [Thermodesulfobacteria bacterium]|nr:DUF3365 domain-containing protein [Thermodesulfobacteriota bacterium]
MKKIQRLSLADKVALFFLLVLAFGAVGIYHSAKQTQEKELLESARGIADLLENFLAATESFGGLWVTKTQGIKAVAKASGVTEENGDEVDFFRLHDPEIANYMTTFSKPSQVKVSFDLRTFASEEKWAFKDKSFQYERPVVVKKSCVSCHEATKGAPFLRQGETAGVIRVTFLEKSLLSLLGGSVSLGGALALFIITIFLYGLVKFELLTPLTNLSQKVREMSLGNLDIDLGVANLSEEQTRDEITKLAISIERLRKSQKTMEKMLDDDSLVL